MKLIIAAVFFLATLANASEGPPPVLNIKSYASPSGHYVLTVDPSHRLGEGKGSYRMVRDGKESWKKDLDYTFWEASVQDDGSVAGYAYTQGWRAMGRDAGNFVVAILNPDGSERMNRTVARIESRALHTAPGPLARGCLVANGRFIIRFDENANDLMKRGERWEVYNIAKGTQDPDKTLAGQDLGQHGFSMVFDVHAVPGTKLILVSRVVHRYGQKATQGIHLALVDRSCKEVWSKEWPDEFSGIENFSAWMLESDELTASGDLKPSQFVLRSVKSQSRTTFLVSQAGEEAWKVEEVGQAPEAVTLRHHRARDQKLVGTPVTLEHRGTITLDGGSGDSAPLGVPNFEFDGAGRIGFISVASGPLEFSLVDPQHPPAKKFPLGMKHEDGLAFPGCSWIGGDKWVIVRGSYDDHGKTSITVLNTADGSLTPAPDVECPSPSTGQGIFGMGERGFMVMGGFRSRYQVKRIGQDLKSNWEFDGPDVIGSPQSIAVQPDGTVGILVGISDVICVFDEKGAFKRKIDLKSTLGRKPNYVSGLAEDAAGGWVLSDFSGTPSVYRLNADGGIVKSFTPHYADGRKLEIHGRLNRGPDGRLWTTDQAALLRLDDDGKVDLVVGRAPDASSLSDIHELVVTARGIFAVDAHNYGIHIFDVLGKRQSILKPDPADFGSRNELATLAVAGDGSVYLGNRQMFGGSKYLKFAADGSRAGFERGMSGEVSDEWVFRPGSQERIVLGYERVFMVDAEGKKARTIERRADRKWLDHPHAAAIASDGTFAIIADPSSWSSGDGESVTFFTAGGEPVRTVELPGMRFARIALCGRHACIMDENTLTLIDSGTGECRQFTVPGDHKQSWLYPYASPDGKEVWLLDGDAKTLERYALP